MGKKQSKPPEPQAPAAPSFSPSEIIYNGRVTGKTYMRPDGTIATEYLQDPAEQERIARNQALIRDYESRINVFDPSLQNDWNNTANAFEQNQLEDFNKMNNQYQSQIRDDVVSRFGNFNNSIYENLQKDLSETNAKTLAGIARDKQLLKNDLRNQELGNRYNYLNYLQGTSDAANALGQQAYQTATGLSNYGNQFNQNNYGQAMNQYGIQMDNYQKELQRQQQARGGLFNKIFGGLLGVGSLGVSALTGRRA